MLPRCPYRAVIREPDRVDARAWPARSQAVAAWGRLAPWTRSPDNGGQDLSRRQSQCALRPFTRRNGRLFGKSILKPSTTPVAAGAENGRHIAVPRKLLTILTAILRDQNHGKPLDAQDSRSPGCSASDLSPRRGESPCTSAVVGRGQCGESPSSVIVCRIRPSIERPFCPVRDEVLGMRPPRLRRRFPRECAGRRPRLRHTPITSPGNTGASPQPMAIDVERLMDRNSSRRRG